MYYFLPAWYNDLPAGASFGATESFSGGGTVHEFDDTVHQIRMFLSAGEEAQLMTLCYAPTLRHILHRQTIYPLRIHSAFDLIQGIRATEPAVFSFRDMIGNAEIEWVYTPFVVLGYLHDALHVCVSFGEDGSFLQADYYDEAYLVCATDYYDDRGFLSSTLYYENRIAVSQHYYDEQGLLRMEHNLLSGAVTLHGEAKKVFPRAAYASLEELLGDAFAKMTAHLTKEDMLIVAASARHNAIALNAPHGADVVLSFFEDRYDLSKEDALSSDLSMVRLVVTDTAFTARRIGDVSKGAVPVYDISPFDTRLPLGMSQRARTAQILLPVDTLAEPYFSRALTQIFAYLNAHERTSLYAVTGNAEAKDALLQQLKRIRTEGGFAEVKAADETGENAVLGENDVILSQGALSPQPERMPQIHVVSYQSENDLIRMLKDVRLIVDVSDQPLLYLQIAGISAGIPQVNYRFTRYVEHKKDGFIIENIDHLGEALEYYLSSLANWNEALVYCVGLSEQYSGERIVARWKELAGANG